METLAAYFLKFDGSFSDHRMVMIRTFMRRLYLFSVTGGQQVEGRRRLSVGNVFGNRGE